MLIIFGKQISKLISHPLHVSHYLQTEAQRTILDFLCVCMVTDDNINYLHKFIMLNSKEDWILLHNLHVLKSYSFKN